MHVFLAVFLHLLAFTMGGPIIPSLRAHFQLDAAQTGLISSALTAGMLFGVVALPRLSDSRGRKPALLTSYLGFGMGLVLQAGAIKFNLPFEVFLALRVLSGACAGATTVVRAYIADVSDPAALPRATSYHEAAATLSHIVGPTLGGFLFVLTDLPSVVLTSGFVSIFAAGWVSVFLRSPTPSAAKDTPEGTLPSGEVEGERSEVAWLAMAALISTHFLYYVAQAFLDALFSVACAERFGLDARVLGLMTTSMSCLVLFMNTTVYSRVEQRFGVVRTAVAGLLLVAARFLVLTVPWTLWAVAASMLFYGVGVPLFTPSVPALLGQIVPQERRGFILGIDYFVCSIARIASPVLLGMLYKRSLEVACCWAGLAALVAAGLMGTLQERLRTA